MFSLSLSLSLSLSVSLSLKANSLMEDDHGVLR